MQETVIEYEPWLPPVERDDAGPFERTRWRILPDADGLLTLDGRGWIEGDWLFGVAARVDPLGVWLQEA